jgi:OOP family OmpA-OmpF porin
MDHGRSFVAGMTAALCLCMGSVQAQDGRTPSPSLTGPLAFTLPGGNSYFGINLGRAAIDTNCPATLLFCESRDRSAQVHAGHMFSANWGAELGYLDTGRLVRPLGESRATGFSVSLVGRAQVLPSLGVYGKVGTAYGRPDTSVMGNAATGGPEQGFGLAFGGGVSYELTPRLSATFEWDSYDLRLASGPVRSGTLGLRYRY